MALGSYSDLGKHFYSNLFTFILLGIEPALPKPGYAHIPISVCSQIRGNRPTKTTMHESNSFRSTEILEHLMSPGESSPRPTPSQARGSAARKTADAESNSAADVVVDGVIGEITEQFRLREILEEACVLTGATGAAIALARGKELVCLATAGADAPDLGVCLDPNSGLSGSCIQNRQLQRCDDTETDLRVDPEACRQLGVRSIAVLPLVRGNELLGVFEILSSSPNAFGQDELDSMRALSGRILQRERDETESTTKVPTKSSAPPPSPEKISVRNPTRTPIFDPGNPRRNQASRRRNLWNPILGMLVIIAALLLGVLVGLRTGWERATLQNRHRALPQGASALTNAPPSDVTPPPNELNQRSVPAAERVPETVPPSRRVSAATKNPAPSTQRTQHPSGSTVVLVEPPSTSAHKANLQSSQRSQDQKENSQQGNARSGIEEQSEPNNGPVDHR